MRLNDIPTRFAALLFLLLIGAIAYWVEQDQFSLNLLLFAPAFLLTYYFGNLKPEFNVILTVGVLARIIVLILFPSLSDDFYRFMWDGHLVLDGFNPYKYTPTEIIELIPDKNLYGRLYPLLNSPHYFSVYPPLSQGLFMLTAWISGSSIWLFQFILGIIILLGDIGLFYLLRFLLSRWHSDGNAWLSYYFLNPYVILEFCGNLHMDLFLCLFALLSLKYTLHSKYWIAGIFAGLACGFKPQIIILLPFFLLYPRRHSHRLAIISAFIIISMLIYSPIILQNHSFGFVESLDLYFRKFEFNGSLYLLFRWIGLKLTGYNAIAYVGPILGILAMTIIFILLIYAYSKSAKNSAQETHVLKFAAYAFGIYLLFSTTVHPWYILPVLVLGLATRQFWPFIWSYSILWSYSFYDPVYHHWHLLFSLFAYLTPALVALYHYGHKKREASL